MILFRKFLTTSLLLSFALTSPLCLADTSDQQSIEELVRKAKVAFDARDDKTYDPIMDRIFERVTGFPSSLPNVPEGISDDDYIQKMCEYDRITQSIYSTEFWNVVRFQAASMAYSVVHEGTEHDVRIRAMTECRFEDGRLTKSSQLMNDGISWAKKFQAADAKEALQMAQDIKELATQNPKIKELETFAKLVGFHAQDKQEAEVPKQGKKFFPRATLVGTADKGNLEAQLEVARRLETGDCFKQDDAMAYFWYQRALKNGGGEAAQAGLDRLLPRLTDIDFISIKIWTKNNHRPY